MSLRVKAGRLAERVDVRFKLDKFFWNGQSAYNSKHNSLLNVPMVQSRMMCDLFKASMLRATIQQVRSVFRGVKR
jgi:hypothetical protein